MNLNQIMLAEGVVGALMGSRSTPCFVEGARMQDTELLCETPGALLAAMRRRNPLVQNITNFVAMNIAANILLAAGASPAMVHSPEEAADFAKMAGALTVNIGTLSPEFLGGMLQATTACSSTGIPWVLDPVAHFATPFRRSAVTDLLAQSPTVIRGNASEIIALAGEQSKGQGVDAGDDVDCAEQAAASLAIDHRCVVAVTGERDFVTDGSRSVRIFGGSIWMPRVTALGCSLTCLIGAFVATRPDNPFDSTVAALVLFAAAGELAQEGAQGPGSFLPLFLDQLALVTPGALDTGTRVQAA